MPSNIYIAWEDQNRTRFLKIFSQAELIADLMLIVI